METVEIRISREGKVSIQAKGVVGSACQQLTAPFEQALGVVASDQPTEEMYQEAGAVNSQEA